MILIGTNQKSCIEAFGYNEHILLFENLGEQPDAFRLPVVNGTGLAQSREPQKHFGSYEEPTYTLGAVESESSAKSSHWGQNSCQPCQHNLTPILQLCRPSDFLLSNDHKSYRPYEQYGGRYAWQAGTDDILHVDQVSSLE